MNGDLHLDSLLNALRTAGLRVGISETLRLRQVFLHEPALAGGNAPRERLRSLLRAVLVKSAEDRNTFDRVCDAWLDRADGELELHRMRRQPVPVPPVQRKGFSRARLLRQAAKAAVLALLLLSVDQDTRTQKQALTIPGKIPITDQGLPEAPDVTPDDVRRRTRPTTVATLTVTTRRWLALLRPEMALAVLAWLSTGGLWLALRRRRLLPEPRLAPPAPGPSRAFPLSVAPAGAVLLAPREQEGLVWGIGRFVSEEPTRRLDLPATVRATALAGGLPEMRFHRARFYREVWLWLDEDADDPALPRLAAEIETVLASHGLPVERAAFRGLPHRLVTADGQAFAPNEIDERRDVALVAILTDGRRLVRRYAADDQRVRIDALLRSLSHWPHLAFVDASQGESGLAAILGRHGLAAVAPARAAAFLGGALRAPATSAGRADVEGEAAWAAVCALCPAPLDEATALELRRRLELTVSPYSLQALRTEAPGPPGRLAWRSAGRVRRVRWLREAEAHPEGTVLRGSLLDRALAFWENLYDRTLAEHAGQEDREETPAVRVLRMERALLGLWRGTEGHVAELYRLYQGPLREAIEHHLETLAPSDWGGPDVIHLPWPWSQPAPVERAMLREMRFGGGMPPVGLRRPGRAWLGIGLLAGLGFAAAGMAIFRPDCRNETIEENGLTFVRICPGTFTMGSRSNDPLADEDEKPAHQVNLGEFWMSKYEVTNKQYRELNPDHYLREEPDLPVTNVTWIEAKGFCEKLGYLLPTEAEWEYAARAGTETPWSSGSDPQELDRYAWFDEDISGEPHPVGGKEPNPWGLHDMHGNVWEWVEDWYGSYSAGPQVNPTGPPNGDRRVLRGGSFVVPARGLRAADRGWVGPEVRGGGFGFRCVRAPRRQP